LISSLVASASTHSPAWRPSEATHAIVASGGFSSFFPEGPTLCFFLMGARRRGSPYSPDRVGVSSVLALTRYFLCSLSSPPSISNSASSLSPSLLSTIPSSSSEPSGMGAQWFGVAHTPTFRILFTIREGRDLKSSPLSNENPALGHRVHLRNHAHLHCCRHDRVRTRAHLRRWHPAKQVGCQSLGGTPARLLGDPPRERPQPEGRSVSGSTHPRCARF
jgi:hypothetical protein